MNGSRMPRKSMKMWEYWCPNSGAKPVCGWPWNVPQRLVLMYVSQTIVDRVRRRAEREDQQDHGLVVAVPFRLDEAGLRMPAHGDPARIVHHPLPVHAAVERIGERADLRFRVSCRSKYSLAEQHAGHEQRGVDGGQLDALEAWPVCMSRKW
jgi:hypothetical protein